jgi:hypothetical protein
MGNAQDEDVIIASSLSIPSEAFDNQTAVSIEDVYHSDAEDVEERPAISSYYDIISWNEKVVDSETNALFLALDSFERGSISGMSANDIFSEERTHKSISLHSVLQVKFFLV